MNTDLIDKAIDDFKGVWPEFIPEGRVLCHTETHGFCQGCWDSKFAVSDKDEFEARVAERQNKPSWDDAPDLARWVAQDCDGEWYFYEHKPTPVNDTSFVCNLGSESYSTKGEVIIPWQDTLEERPVDESKPTPVKDHPLKDEIEEKLNSGELVVNGAVESYKPEVGGTCEFRFRSASLSWSKCECLGIDNEYVWIRKSGIPGGGSVYSWGSIELRPIQSPKQQFVQAAMEINNRMIDADMNDTSLIFGAVFEELVDKPN